MPGILPSITETPGQHGSPLPDKQQQQLAKTGGFKPCTLTWYDPALGGTNSGTGQADPTATMANGQPYNAKAYTCAADPSFAFGTKLDIRIGMKECVVTVTDRGGAITGSHFDLSRAAAQTLGIIQEGTANGEYLETNLPAGAKGSPFNSAVGAVTSGVDGVTSAIGDIGQGIGFLFSKQFLYIVGGGVLVIVALIMLLSRSKAGDTIVSAAGKIPLPVPE